MAKRNFKKLLDEARKKANSESERIFIPGKIVDYSEEEIAKNPSLKTGTALDIRVPIENINAYYDALEHALELGDQTRLHWLLENEVVIPKSYLPVLLKAIYSVPPSGEQCQLTISEKIKLCSEIQMEVYRKKTSYAKVFQRKSEEYGVDIKTIENWWKEANETVAPLPGVNLFPRRSKAKS